MSALLCPALSRLPALSFTTRAGLPAACISTWQEQSPASRPLDARESGFEPNTRGISWSMGQAWHLLKSWEQVSRQTYVLPGIQTEVASLRAASHSK